jgi:hypothetical protein
VFAFGPVCTTDVTVIIANQQGHRMLKQNEENRILANMLPVVANSLREII